MLLGGEALAFVRGLPVTEGQLKLVLDLRKAHFVTLQAHRGARLVAPVPEGEQSVIVVGRRVVALLLHKGKAWVALSPTG